MKPALWLATLILVVCSRPLFACSCAPQTTQQLFTNSAIVFLATTTNVEFIDQDAPTIEPRIKVNFADAERLCSAGGIRIPCANGAESAPSKDSRSARWPAISRRNARAGPHRPS